MIVTVGKVQGGACHITRGQDGVCDGMLGSGRCLPCMLQSKRTMMLVTVGKVQGGGCD